ncbi:hypothetical protein, partial [Bacillus sp. Cr_A10]|uniref:hypothetical protein n=1 Tax=Bacillus sp. Cr_A10 TaxID=3033993 RepID=UPI0023DC102D
TRPPGTEINGSKIKIESPAGSYLDTLFPLESRHSFQSTEFYNEHYILHLLVLTNSPMTKDQFNEAGSIH